MSDVSDCQWIQYLHSVGLRRASFRPPGVICAIRSLWRHRASLIEMAAEHALHMQKALDQMNLQIHRVLNDITGSADCEFWMPFWLAIEIRCVGTTVSFPGQEQPGYGGQGTGGRLSQGIRLRPETVAREFPLLSPARRRGRRRDPSPLRDLEASSAAQAKPPARTKKVAIPTPTLRTHFVRFAGRSKSAVAGCCSPRVAGHAVGLRSRYEWRPIHCIMPITILANSFDASREN
jgi:hypothetical protein